VVADKRIFGNAGFLKKGSVVKKGHQTHARRGGHRGSKLGYSDSNNISGLAFSPQRSCRPDNDVLVETGARLLVVAALGRTRRRSWRLIDRLADQRRDVVDTRAAHLLRGGRHFSIMFGLAHQRSLSGRWGWLVPNGIIDLFLVGVILFGLPGTAAWVLGLQVGIDLVYGGSALIALSLSAHRSKSA
jgi:hypothetical protein